MIGYGYYGGIIYMLDVELNLSQSEQLNMLNVLFSIMRSLKLEDGYYHFSVTLKLSSDGSFITMGKNKLIKTEDQYWGFVNAD